MEKLIQSYDKLNNITKQAGNTRLVDFLIISFIVLFICFIFTINDYHPKEKIKKVILVLVEISFAFGCIFAITTKQADESAKNYYLVEEAEKKFVDENYVLYTDTFLKINNKEIPINEEEKNKLKDINKIFEKYDKDFKNTSKLSDEVIGKEKDNGDITIFYIPR